MVFTYFKKKTVFAKASPSALNCFTVQRLTSRGISRLKLKTTGTPGKPTSTRGLETWIPNSPLHLTEQDISLTVARRLGFQAFLSPIKKLCERGMLRATKTFPTL